MNSTGKIILISLILIPGILFGQSKQNEIKKYKISIEQQILPGSNPNYIYKIKNNNIKIIKKQPIFNSLIYLSYEIYSMRLDRNQTDSLRLVLKNANIFILDYSYDSGSLDGINWTFKIRINKQFKEVRLDNYYLKELGDIVDFMNRQIPKKKVCVSFDFLGTRNDFTNK